MSKINQEKDQADIKNLGTNQKKDSKKNETRT